VQGTPELPSRDRCIRLPGALAGPHLVECDHGIERGIVLANLSQMVLDHFNRRGLSRMDDPGQLSGRLIYKMGHDLLSR
jgi:hypothetical protein